MLDLKPLLKLHGYRDSVRWKLTARGVEVDGRLETTRGAPATIRRIWSDHRVAILEAAKQHSVPVELIIATAATETKGNARALRREPGYESDARTPHKVSPGIMQTLISTARMVMRRKSIDRDWLFNPANSFVAGTGYIRHQARKTKLDPPAVACAYNAGSVYYQKGHRNRWKMRQYPIGTGKHADRFVQWFNDCFRMFAEDGAAPPMSFYHMINGSTQPAPPDVPPVDEPPQRRGLLKFIIDLILGVFSRRK